MSQLEPMVKKLQAMTSFDELADFFNTMQMQYKYKFCGLVLWHADDKRDIVAASQTDDFKAVASQTALRQICLKRFTPALSSELEPALDLVSDALVVPLRGNGLEAAALIIGLQPEQATMAQQIAWYWSIVANYLYEAIHRFMRVSEQTEHFMLTCREHACLVWAAKGKTSWEISQILSISERTVNFHLGNCIRKTNSCNRQQAISKCVAGGHIYV
ncbi:helix-turn-helix transcriptional regulator [Rheinheimera tangshanensis]|jgi:DNA-binding CsgD family transcriptional regulator|uniref:Helix-turn-helix transcriptional regulator n=2 Tax=Rheinheimera tangshanensis TaxID=400153 RepID=A0A5C8LSE3_9GAMM|nr:helix-turn-helix domain-containing protein [Rheinheimera sp. KL1]TXK80226.1 helix-turn-helix transcriptional regulator [Rheinheimera tangshanensis]GGM66150.1 transcriptional regulator [Rheinheimera tangshanensis]